MLAIGNNKIDQNSNQVNLLFHSVCALNRKFEELLEEIVSLGKGLKDINVKIDNQQSEVKIRTK
jgi:hypothetical protein